MLKVIMEIDFAAVRFGLAWPKSPMEKAQLRTPLGVSDPLLKRFTEIYICLSAKIDTV